MPVIEVDEELYMIIIAMRKNKIADKAIRNFAKAFLGLK